MVWKPNTESKLEFTTLHNYVHRGLPISGHCEEQQKDDYIMSQTAQNRQKYILPS